MSMLCCLHYNNRGQLFWFIKPHHYDHCHITGYMAQIWLPLYAPRWRFMWEQDMRVCDGMPSIGRVTHTLRTRNGLRWLEPVGWHCL